MKRRIARLRGRGANVRSRELQALAEAAGWSVRSGGKHMTYAKPGRPALAIPAHPGALKPGTVHKILDIIEGDYE